jgi:hypothetical protein
MTDIDPMRLVGHLKNLLRYELASCVCDGACAMVRVRWCVCGLLTCDAHTRRTHAFRERLGLKGLISLRLLAKGQSVEDAEVEAEAEKGQPLDPKKTLREQGVFDGCDILVTQVLTSYSPDVVVCACVRVCRVVCGASADLRVVHVFLQPK